MNRVFHDKWAVSPEILERRWGKKQEEKRDLFDMEEFLYGWIISTNQQEEQNMTISIWSKSIF